MTATSNRIERLLAVVILVLQMTFFVGQPVIGFEGASAKTLKTGKTPLDHLSRPPLLTEINRAGLGESYARLPLSFEPNQGQTDSSVKFFTRGRGYGLFLTSTEAVLVLSKKPKTETSPRLLREQPGPSPIENPKSTVVRMQLSGTVRVSELKGIDELPGRVNYFIGNDPAKWRTNVPTYAKVRYRGVYPGIDLTYYGNGPQLEYDFEVAPGADPSAIRLAFKGTDEVSIDGEGSLVVKNGGQEVHSLKPVAYQRVRGNRQEVAAEYVLLANREVAFKVGRHNDGEALVIDPVLAFSTYLGGNSDDHAWSIAVDRSSNVYVAGVTISRNFPTANPLQPSGGGSHYDAFVTKLNPAGSVLLYSTYLGGTLGDESCQGIAVDASGNAYLTGVTGSANFPTVNPVQAAYGGADDAFVAKLNAAGSALVYSTYLGGKDVDVGNSVAVDSMGNAYVTGLTFSMDFPTANALQPFPLNHDAFVAKLNAAGSALLYSTYLGGFGNQERGFGIAVDISGNAYVTGGTDSNNFPTTMNAVQRFYGGGTSDVFVAKFNAAGSALLYSTYLGGSAGDIGFGIAVDSSGSAYITGRTDSTDFPTASPVQPANGGGFDAFVTKLNAAGSALVYSTYLGGSGTFADEGYGIAVDVSGNAYVTGYTASTDFPIANPLPPGSLRGLSDAFAVKLNATGSRLLYSTYLGGDQRDFGQAIAVDGSGNAYLAGFTESTDFPTAKPLQPAKDGFEGFDAFVATIYDPLSLPLRFIPVTPCRVADTRNSPGPLGGPSLMREIARSFPVPMSSCGIPSTAKAYSLNATVVPHGSLGYLTLWATGAPLPPISILNASDGLVTATAAIVQAGLGGSINAFATDDTDLILDINGYFLDTTSTTALLFYPITPCRIADTREPDGPLGGPILMGGATRSFPLLLSSCGIPATAQAYAINATALPDGFLDHLTLWATGMAQPVVSNLNASDGQPTANMAIVAAGAGGAINANATNNTHLVLDVTGYFAPPAPGGLHLFTVTPCRVLGYSEPRWAIGRTNSVCWNQPELSHTQRWMWYTGVGAGVLHERDGSTVGGPVVVSNHMADRVGAAPRFDAQFV
jgi:hypothetical protein